MLCFRLERTNEASSTLARWMLRRRAVRECSRASADPPTALSPSRLSTGIFEVQGCDRPNFFGKTDHELLDLQFRPHMTIISNEPKSTVCALSVEPAAFSANQSSFHCQRLSILSSNILGFFR